MKKSDEYRRFLEENPDRVRTDPDGRGLFSDVVQRLRSMPEPDAREDFVSRVMERVAREEAEERAAGRGRPLRWAVRIAAAAAVAVVCAAGWRAWVAPAENGETMGLLARNAAAKDFIVGEQEADGAWRAAVPSQDGALSAIALMALIRDDADPLGGAHAEAVRGGMEHLVALEGRPQGAGDGATGMGRSSRYLVAMALRSGSALPGAPADWRAAAERAAKEAPAPAEAVRLNRMLAHSGTMPEPWKKAGGAVLVAALELLEPRAM